MKASDKDVLTTKIYFQSAFPALRFVFEEDAKQKKAFANIDAIVEFRAADDVNPLACYIVILTEKLAEKTAAGKRYKVYQGEYPGYIEMADGTKYNKLPVSKFYFKSIKSLLGVFKGDSPLEMTGIVAPLLKNIAKPATLKFLFMMLELMKTMPNCLPTLDQPWEQYIKVKLSLNLICRALSVTNKENWSVFKKWGMGQPDRTYQFKVGPTIKDGKEIYPEITANLRLKTITDKTTGEKVLKTKSSHGVAKYPFVLFDFPNPDSCIKVLAGQTPFVECVDKKYVTITGAGDSYAVTFNNLMTECQNMLVPSKLVVG